MNSLYANIVNSVSAQEKLLAILIDPDKLHIDDVREVCQGINESSATHIFVGGSTVNEHATETLVQAIKKHINLPIILFPGDETQITEAANAILFLSLISGREPEYLIGKHVRAVSKLKESSLEVISTGYLLIESGNISAVQRVTQTIPMSRDNIQSIVDTAIAGELLGMKLIYLEAGSGANAPISEAIINSVKQNITIPLIVGGGIKTKDQLQNTYKAGADLVVIGTAIEDNLSFLNDLK